MINITHHRPIKCAGIALFNIPVGYKLPTTWAELSRDQVVAFAQMLLLYHRPFGEYRRDMQLHYLGVLLGMKPAQYYRLTDLQVAIMLRKIEPIFDEWAPATDSIKYVYVGRDTYYLPGDALAHLSMGAWAMAEEYYREIIEGRDTRKNTALLVATLLSERSGAERPPYDTDQSTALALRMLDDTNGVDFIVQFAVYHYYWACRQAIIKKYRKVFHREDESASQIDLTSQDRWIGVIHDLAEQGAFGTWQQVADTSMHTVLHFLNRQRNKMRELELKQKLS